MQTSDRRLFRLGTVVALALIVAGSWSPLFAQDEAPMGEGMMQDMAGMEEAMEMSMTPGPQHAMMAKGAGTWKLTAKMWMDPAAEPMISEGTAERHMDLAGHVLVENVSATMMGMPFLGIGYTGYDNVTGKWWSTWTDTMMTGLMTMTGTLDEATGTQTFDGEMPNAMTGGMTPVQVKIRYEGEGREVMEMFQPGPDGSMMRAMEIVYERQQ